MRSKWTILLAVLLALALLAACGENPSPAEIEEADAAAVEVEAVDSDHADSPTDKSEEAPQEEVPEEETPSPLYAHQIADGTYAIEVSSSSSMFRIVDARLTVEGDAMRAVLTLSGTGYEKLYVGTGDQALADSDEACSYYVEDQEGKYTYEVPVEALDLELDLAAWSIRKETWYDRTVVYHSALIPQDSVVTGS